MFRSPPSRDICSEIVTIRVSTSKTSRKNATRLWNDVLKSLAFLREVLLVETLIAPICLVKPIRLAEFTLLIRKSCGDCSWLKSRLGPWLAFAGASIGDASVVLGKVLVDLTRSYDFVVLVPEPLFGQRG